MLTQNLTFMLNLNKCFLFLLMLGFQLLPGQAQVCNPDTTVNSLGLFPDTLATATQGQPYSSVLNAGLPRDTAIFPGVPPLAFCSYRIDSTQPALSSLGLQFDCDQSDCFYEVDHSMDINFGCVVVSGTPTEIFIDSITVFVSAKVGNYNASTNTCTVTDSTTLGALEFKVPFSIFANLSSIEASSHFGALSLAPNPTSSFALLNFELEEIQDVEVSIRDLRGREVLQAFRGRLGTGSQEIEIPTSALPAGIYLLRLSAPEKGQVATKKLVVRK